MTKRVSANNALMFFLIFVPITLFLEYVVHASPTLLFLASALNESGEEPFAGVLRLVEKFPPDGLKTPPP